MALRERDIDVVFTPSKVRYQRDKTRKADMKELEGKMVTGKFSLIILDKDAHISSH